MRLEAYLRRIGLKGPVRPDLETLRAVHRAHLLAIPYENLDVQLGRPLTTDVGEAYDKIVEWRRGGWCYEMNGLLGWALEEIGFEVTRLAGGVMRSLRGEGAVGNHLILRVALDQPWIADAGFGDGPLLPYPLQPGPIANGFRVHQLLDLGDGWLRLESPPPAEAFSFDFRLDRADEAQLSAQCAWLQTAPESPFVQNLVLQRHTLDALLILRGRVLRTLSGTGPRDRVLEDAADLIATLDADFGIRLPEAASLWPAICARHEAVFGADPQLSSV